MPWFLPTRPRRTHAGAPSLPPTPPRVRRSPAPPAQPVEPDVQACALALARVRPPELADVLASHGEAA